MMLLAYLYSQSTKKMALPFCNIIQQVIDIWTIYRTCVKKVREIWVTLCVEHLSDGDCKRWLPRAVRASCRWIGYTRT
jgi:hypothetical protein